MNKHYKLCKSINGSKKQEINWKVPEEKYFILKTAKIREVRK